MKFPPKSGAIWGSRTLERGSVNATKEKTKTNKKTQIKNTNQGIDDSDHPSGRRSLRGHHRFHTILQKGSQEKDAHHASKLQRLWNFSLSGRSLLCHAVWNILFGMHEETCKAVRGLLQ